LERRRCELLVVIVAPAHFGKLERTCFRVVFLREEEIGGAVGGVHEEIVVGGGRACWIDICITNKGILFRFYSANRKIW